MQAIPDQSEDKTPEVTLHAFRFLDPTNISNQSASQTLYPTQTAEDKFYASNQPTYDFRRSRAFEQMGADKPGRELAPDAAIWNLYLDEAQEHDNELVKGRQQSLDTLLLFAALFSAILTAFIIESKDLLQQDPVDASVVLLRFIAQSQQRIELGLPTTDQTIPYNEPEFSPSSSARWINGMWFTSLGLSLSTALIAMLGKEWLTAFLSSRPRAPHKHALLRQSRLEGLEGWWALHIIALLPSLLHASLLLFSIGLVIYLWILDTVIAAVIAGVIGLTLLFYCLTAVLGAVYEFCPFVTEISGYMRRATVAIFGRQNKEEDTVSRIPSLKDVQAVLWLTSNARDPAIVDCSYQALSGLHHSLYIHPLGPTDNTGLESNSERSATPELAIPQKLNDDTDMSSLLAMLVERFEKHLAGSFELGGFESPVSRYANAILGIIACMKRSSGSIENISAKPQGFWRAFYRPALKEVSLNSIQTDINAFQLLELIENVWSATNLALSSGAYANILSTEMEVIQLAVQELSTDRPGPRIDTTPDAQITFPPDVQELLAGAPSTHAIIGIEQSPTIDQEDQIFYLRACYSRWLALVSSLLRCHHSGRVVLQPHLLDGLQRAICGATKCLILNPPNSISTHHPQPTNYSSDRDFNIVVPISKDTTFTFQAHDLQNGLLGSIMAILSMNPNTREESLVPTRSVGLETYSSLARILLGQVLGSESSSLDIELEEVKFLYKPPANRRDILSLTIRYMLCTIRLVGMHPLTAAHHMSLCDNALQLVMDYVREDPEKNNLGNASLAEIGHHAGDIIPILELATVNEYDFLALPHRMMFNLIHFAGLTVIEQPLTVCDTLTPGCFPSLIRMVKHVNGIERGVELLVNGMLRRIRTSTAASRPELSHLQHSSGRFIPSICYIQQFTCTSQGFSALAQAGFQESYTNSIMTAITEIVHLAAGRDPAITVDPIELRVDAVPGFLDVVSLTIEHLLGSDNRNRREMFFKFADEALDLIKLALKDPESNVLVSSHSAYTDLWEALQTFEPDSRAQQLMLRFSETTVDIEEEGDLEYV